MPNISLQDKISNFKKLVSSFISSQNDIDVFSSPETGYRLRCEFRIWHNKILNTVEHVVFSGKQKKVITVNHYPIACNIINRLIPIITSYLSNDKTLKNKLFQIDYLTSMTNEVVISLIYHNPVNQELEIAAVALRDFLLNETSINVNIICRSRKQKIVIGKDYVLESFKVHGKDIKYYQIENSFSQPNGYINQIMLNWVVKNINKNHNLKHSDILELYCGIGNFTMAIADCCRYVFATEVNKIAVASALKNIEINNIKNVKVIRLSAEEFTQAINKEREFNRLKDNNIDLDDYDFKTILVDPPRSGLDDKSLDMIKQFQRIIYISCNPLTLVDNLETLTKTHKIVNIALFDQFPQTNHIESGLILEKI